MERGFLINLGRDENNDSPRGQKGSHGITETQTVQVGTELGRVNSGRPGF